MNFRHRLQQSGFLFWVAVSLPGLGGFMLTNAVHADDTATLKGRFVFDGIVQPVPAAINVNRDIQVCGGRKLVVEELLVGQDGGIANVIVWLNTKGVLPKDDKIPVKPAVLNMQGCRFEPHILLVRAGQPLEITNSDPIGHLAMAAPRFNPWPNFLPPAGGGQGIIHLVNPEKLPFPVSCSIHPWVRGYIFVRDSPYMALSAPGGVFQIPNLPSGQELEFQTWHEKCGYVKQVHVGGAPATWGFGKFKMTLKAGVNDLGVIKALSLK